MSRIKSSVKMGQGRRQRGPALASAGQRPVRRASLRLRRSRPTALGPRGLRLAGPRLQGCLAGRGRRHAVRAGEGPPLPGTRWRPALAGRGRRRAGCGGRGTTAARYALARRSGGPRLTARRLRGSGDCRSPACAGPPIGPAEVTRQHAAALRSAPLKREGR